MWKRVSGREGTHGGDDSREPLSAEASDMESISENRLFFPELIQPPESMCYDLLLPQ
jgi:hypothetical protein